MTLFIYIIGVFAVVTFTALYNRKTKESSDHFPFELVFWLAICSWVGIIILLVGYVLPKFSIWWDKFTKYRE